ncbi:23 kDa integral membrane protein-like [Ostrinia furnacalis]|uniref:23 kDa integral membrane protein-like n=1 Tax=Ostrinia furnacalis TaxID=93504 RepID=UPI00103C1A48|nr:23 kDa integral membrane protein-like [Ostrinia furnacalis]
MSKSCAYVTNSVHGVLGLALACAAIWLYVEVKQITDLRNSNHYLLDYNLYWPQVIPWLFILVGILVFSISFCGVFGAKKSSKGLVYTHVIFVSISIFAAITAAIVALVFVDNKVASDFIKDTIWDVYFQSKTDQEVATAFGTIEKRMQCCGADGPRDYVNWKDNFPQSCCDVNYHGFLEPYAIDCDITNKRANERHGCTEVATQYSSIAVKVLSAISILIAVVGIANLLTSIQVSKKLGRRPRKVENAQVEFESKKVLL